MDNRVPTTYLLASNREGDTLDSPGPTRPVEQEGGDWFHLLGHRKVEGPRAVGRHGKLCGHQHLTPRDHQVAETGHGLAAPHMEHNVLTNFWAAGGGGH